MLMSSNQGQILVFCFGEESGQETGALNPHTAICVRYEENNGISPWYGGELLFFFHFFDTVLIERQLTGISAIFSDTGALAR